MSLIKSHASTALIMKPDSTLSECVRAMRDRGFGAVLVSEPHGKGLAGIFTERDLLKWIAEIEDGGAWNKPVFLLMSKPVLTISIEEIGAAPRIMIERGIRHLPVVHPDPDTGESIVSMISMRDIMRTLLESGRFAKADLLREIRVGIMAQSKGIRQLLRKMCAERGGATVEEVSVDIPANDRDLAMIQLDYLIFDLDHLDAATWSITLREINSLAKHPEVILIYNPSLHEEKELEVLTKLKLSGRFSAYMKPLNLYAVMDRLV